MLSERYLSQHGHAKALYQGSKLLTVLLVPMFMPMLVIMTMVMVVPMVIRMVMMPSSISLNSWKQTLREFWQSLDFWLNFFRYFDKVLNKFSTGHFIGILGFLATAYWWLGCKCVNSWGATGQEEGDWVRLICCLDTPWYVWIYLHIASSHTHKASFLIEICNRYFVSYRVVWFGHPCTSNV